MATIVPQRAQEESAARRFWGEKMAEHPDLAGLLAIAGSVTGFFLNGHCIVALARWVIRVSGYVAESALLFAVLWISGTSVAPHLVELVMSEETMQYLVWLALVTLALVPEVILANAIVNALGHAHTAVQKKTVVSWIWAALFIIPTAMFLALTAYTLNNLVANGGNYVQASAGLVGWRCFAGWSYGLLELVYAGMGRRMLHSSAPDEPQPVLQPALQIDYQEIARHLQPVIQQEVRQAVPDTTGMGEQLHQLRMNVEELTKRVARQYETVAETIDETNITSFHDAKFHLKQQKEETDFETETGGEPRISRKLKQERSAAKRETQSETRRETNTSRGTARQKALRAIKRNPEIKATELARRVGVTPQYAGQILKQQRL